MGLSGLLALLLAAPVGPAETAAAREQARICESLTGLPSLAACRSALSLGLHPERARFVRRLVMRRLAALERWEELVALYRDEAALRPHDADIHLVLGEALLFGRGDAAAAEASVREALRLGPASAWTHALLGLALQGQGRSPDAVAEFEAAESLETAVFDDRPATRAAYQAARAGTPWP